MWDCYEMMKHNPHSITEWSLESALTSLVGFSSLTVKGGCVFLGPMPGKGMPLFTPCG
jgi:hypothetical protein